MQDLRIDESRTIAGGYEGGIDGICVVGELALMGLIDPSLLPTPWVPDWVLNPILPAPPPEILDPIVIGIIDIQYANPTFDWDAWLFDLWVNNPPITLEFPSPIIIDEWPNPWDFGDSFS